MRRKVLLLSKLLLVALALGAGVSSAQEYKLRAKISLVVVPVTVKGPGGSLIADLKKDDFAIYEDGRRQTITNFTIDPAPLSAAVVVDAGLSQGSLSKIKQTITSLTGDFGPFDEVAVYRYDKFVTKIQDFSGDAETIQTALNTITDIKADETEPHAEAARGPFSIPGPVINGAPVVPPGQLGVINTIPKKPDRVLHDAIFAAATDLAKREHDRRKIVLVISDGQTSGNTHNFDETQRALLQTGIQVFALGLDQPFPFKMFSALQDYATATGGDVYFPSSIQNIENTFATLTAEARNQYILGYVSNNEVAGEGPVFRDISVQVLGRDLKTLHRKGYYQYP